MGDNTESTIVISPSTYQLILDGHLQLTVEGKLLDKEDNIVEPDPDSLSQGIIHVDEKRIIATDAGSVLDFYPESEFSDIQSRDETDDRAPNINLLLNNETEDCVNKDSVSEDNHDNVFNVTEDNITEDNITEDNPNEDLGNEDNLPSDTTMGKNGEELQNEENIAEEEFNDAITGSIVFGEGENGTKDQAAEIHVVMVKTDAENDAVKQQITKPCIIRRGRPRKPTTEDAQDDEESDPDEGRYTTPPAQPEKLTSGYPDYDNPMEIESDDIVVIGHRRCVMTVDQATGKMFAYPIKSGKKPGRPRVYSSVAERDLEAKKRKAKRETGLKIIAMEASAAEAEEVREIVEEVEAAPPVEGSVFEDGVRRGTRKRKRRNLKEYTCEYEEKERLRRAYIKGEFDNLELSDLPEAEEKKPRVNPRLNTQPDTEESSSSFPERIPVVLWPGKDTDKLYVNSDRAFQMDVRTFQLPQQLTSNTSTPSTTPLTITPNSFFHTSTSINTETPTPTPSYTLTHIASVVSKPQHVKIQPKPEFPGSKNIAHSEKTLQHSQILSKPIIEPPKTSLTTNTNPAFQQSTESHNNPDPFIDKTNPAFQTSSEANNNPDLLTYKTNPAFQTSFESDNDPDPLSDKINSAFQTSSESNNNPNLSIQSSSEQNNTTEPDYLKPISTEQNNPDIFAMHKKMMKILTDLENSIIREEDMWPSEEEVMQNESFSENQILSKNEKNIGDHSKTNEDHDSLAELLSSDTDDYGGSNNYVEREKSTKTKKHNLQDTTVDRINENEDDENLVENTSTMDITGWPKHIRSHLPKEWRIKGPIKDWQDRLNMRIIQQKIATASAQRERAGKNYVSDTDKKRLEINDMKTLVQEEMSRINVLRQSDIEKCMNESVSEMSKIEQELLKHRTDKRTEIEPEVHLQQDAEIEKRLEENLSKTTAFDVHERDKLRGLLAFKMGHDRINKLSETEYPEYTEALQRKYKKYRLGRRYSNQMSLTESEVEEMVQENGELLQKDAEIPEENAEISDENAEMLDENGEISEENTEMLEENAGTLQENSEMLEENDQTLHENAESLEENAETLHENVEKLEENGEIIPVYESGEELSDNESEQNENEQNETGQNESGQNVSGQNESGTMLMLNATNTDDDDGIPRLLTIAPKPPVEQPSTTPIKCLYCNFRSTLSHEIKRHIRCAHPDKIHDHVTCKICNCEFLDEVALHTHNKDNHTLYCEECDMVFPSIAKKNRHDKRHVQGGWICEICFKPLMDQYTLDMHRKLVHAISKPTFYYCDYCPKFFTRKSQLPRHVRTHTQERTHPCDQCDYIGLERTDLTKHRRIHKQPTIKCPYETCTRLFRFKSNMDTHVKRVHERTKDYKCGLCEYFGYTLGAVQRHIDEEHATQPESEAVPEPDPELAEPDEQPDQYLNHKPDQDPAPNENPTPDDDLATETRTQDITIYNKVLVNGLLYRVENDRLILDEDEGTRTQTQDITIYNKVLVNGLLYRVENDRLILDEDEGSDDETTERAKNLPKELKIDLNALIPNDNKSADIPKNIHIETQISNFSDAQPKQDDVKLKTDCDLMSCDGCEKTGFKCHNSSTKNDETLNLTESTEVVDFGDVIKQGKWG